MMEGRYKCDAGTESSLGISSVGLSLSHWLLIPFPFLHHLKPPQPLVKPLDTHEENQSEICFFKG